MALGEPQNIVDVEALIPHQRVQTCECFVAVQVTPEVVGGAQSRRDR
jgi:hypothetical protein